jgi:hypothetical protein
MPTSVLLISMLLISMLAGLDVAAALRPELAAVNSNRGAAAAPPTSC